MERGLLGAPGAVPCTLCLQAPCVYAVPSECYLLSLLAAPQSYGLTRKLELLAVPLRRVCF